VETNVVVSIAAVVIAIIAAIITSQHNKKSISLSTEVARKDREDRQVADAQEKGVFLQRVDETEGDVDKVGKIARVNRDDIQTLKVMVSVSDERTATMQRDIHSIVGKIDKLVDLFVKHGRP